ncbi:glycosyltransferase family 4 protein [Pontibacter korlensis]|nr:glycosyltransferase family 4 protein [Pontibacter korlensis]
MKAIYINRNYIIVLANWQLIYYLSTFKSERLDSKSILIEQYYLNRMNVFVIPSWFPSKDHPVSGTMIKEQTEAFCQYYPSVNVGISVWGQQDEDFLLWTKHHIKNLWKVIKANTTPYQTSLLSNLKVYHRPTFTWTRKILKGNLKGVVKSNIENLKNFEADFGPVDVIHAHVGFPAGLIAMEVAEKRNIPFCLSERMGPFPWPHTLNKEGKLLAYYKQPYIKSAVNIAVSPFQQEVMYKQGIMNTVMIPNFVNENIFAPASVANVNTDAFTFFSLSYVAPNKGTDLVVFAAKELLLKYKNINFRIGGDGPFLDHCKELTFSLGIAENFTWLGELDRKAAIQEFQSCNAFVLASQYESMGIVYVEAIACGKPIIATRCGGPETTVNSINGLLVEKDNPVELSKAMEYIVVNREKYSSSNIREDYLRHFSIQAIAPKLYDLYKEIIQNH